MKFIIPFLFCSPLFCHADTDMVKCSPSYVAEEIRDTLMVLGKSGTVELRNSWITVSDDPTFGPTIFNYRWVAASNSHDRIQVCVRCYRSAIENSDAAIDLTEVHRAEKGSVPSLCAK